MSQALYRTWRPALWEEVVGQEHIVTTLKNAIATNKVGHAYLFAGPRGTGKTTSARLLAKAVNCLAEDLSKRP
jgi:DNA polymerase-3 subunit gamma/tau